MVGKQGAEATRQAETASTTGPRRSRGRSPDDGLRLFCILHPASTTLRQLSDEERLAARAGPDVIRLSVGIEDVADLIADLEHALSGALESTASR